MRFFTLFLIPLVAGHTVMTTLFVDGENQGDGVCIRMNRNPDKATFPISPLANNAMACGYDGETASARICPASHGSTLTFEYRRIPDGSGTIPGPIDISHKGPCAVYMKRVLHANENNNAAGPGWFKIWEFDYDASENKWCTEKLIDNNGFLSVKIPEGIEAGPYLVRTELLALHAAQDSPPDPQFYVGCAQVFVKGFIGEGDKPAANGKAVTIDQGTYDLSLPGLTYNIYAKELALPYPMPGPSVYVSKGPSATSGQDLVQVRGLKPEGCILVRDDWCGFEVSSYSDQQGCWASAKECWDQADVCWKTAPPTGNRVCQIWNNKCTNIGDNCTAGNWQGPPNKGQDLTPELKKPGGSLEPFTKRSSTASRKHRRAHH